MDIFLIFFVINTITLVYNSGFVHGEDILTFSQSLSDGIGSKLVSKEGKFRLGFFSPGSSNSRYLGIWFNNIPTQTVVWVANRQIPINDTSGLLRLNNNTGDLVLVSQHNGVVWSSNSTKHARNPLVQLLDSGNLVIRDEQDDNSGTFLWQSFDHPSDTLLPGMKLGWDLRIGLDRHLSAWKSPDDPSPGDFTTGIALYHYPDAYGWKGSQKYFRAGPWNGIRYSGARKIRTSPNGNHNFQSVFSFNFVWNDEEVYNMFYLENKSVIARYVLNQTESYQGQHYIWNSQNSSWLLYSYTPRDICDNYGHCGAYGSCDNTENPQCQCLKGFTPKSPLYWDSLDLNQGCERNKPLDCQKGDGFIKYGGLKLPDTTNTWINRSMNLKECRTKCLQNCSCMAYANTNISERGSGCALWYGDLIDIVQLKSGGEDLFIRMSASEIEKGRTKIKIAVGVVISLIVSLLLVGCYIWRSRACSKGNKENTGANDWSNEVQDEDIQSQLFPLQVIAKATDNFSAGNKLGEGGFGPVYKGTLEDGLEIAVKRLSRSSGQGANEFKNEVALIAKVQHRNLVKLLGCCLQGEEKLLVYEYMPNKSLDLFIFDKTRSRLLDWHLRFHIICGIARGLDYLHHGSRLRIIHRDLKTSNILLDGEMSPKISDFGLARAFGGDQIEGNTSRVVGTYGYMAPEYAFDGQFSVKSDVFSFGVIVLEIISGLKNRGLYLPEQSLNLISHAWRLWKEGRPLELLDSILQESNSLSEALRCIQIGLLCLQQYPEDRPTMSSVIVMLSSDNALNQPKELGLLLGKRSSDQTESSSSRIESSSTNEVSVSLLMGR